MQKKLIYIALTLAAISAIVVYGSLDPSVHHFPRCPIYLLTGLKCPGCGSQRALHHLMNFDIPEAFRDNALIVISIPILALYAIASLLKTRNPKLYKATHNRAAGWIAVTFIALWTIIRNICGF